MEREQNLERYMPLRIDKMHLRDVQRYALQLLSVRISCRQSGSAAEDFAAARNPATGLVKVEMVFI